MKAIPLVATAVLLGSASFALAQTSGSTGASSTETTTTTTTTTEDTGADGPSEDTFASKVRALAQDPERTGGIGADVSAMAHERNAARAEARDADEARVTAKSAREDAKSAREDAKNARQDAAAARADAKAARQEARDAARDARDVKAAIADARRGRGG